MSDNYGDATIAGKVKKIDFYVVSVNTKISEITNKINSMDNKLDTILTNTSLRIVSSSTISELSIAYENYYTNVNPSATLEEKMTFVTEWLQQEGYLK